MTQRPTPEQAAAQRRERLTQLQQQLADGVQQLAGSEGWKQMLNMASKLHRYSANNVLLIILQRPDTQAVAGFRTWQSVGRQVRKGSQALYVLGPVKYKVEVENQDTGEKESAVALRGFKPVPVFAIEDTDGPALPEPPSLSGDAPAELWDGLTAMLSDAGYSVVREEIPGRAKGATDPATKRVRVDPRGAALEQLAVLVHEWHHVSLAHVADLAEYRLHRGKMETEAESATYVALTALGFDTGDWSIEYVTGWSKGDPKVLMATAERVVIAAHRTLDLLGIGEGLERDEIAPSLAPARRHPRSNKQGTHLMSTTPIVVVRIKDLPPDAGTPSRLTESPDNSYSALPEDNVPQLQYLGQRGTGSAVDGLRGWCDTIEDERIEWFPADRRKARSASETYGGILVDGAKLDQLRIDESWMRLEPSPSDTSMGRTL